MAGKFNHSGIFKTVFENRCMKLFVEAYQSSITDKSYSMDWNENDITSLLNNYISKNQKHCEWKIVNHREDYLFDDNPNKHKGFADIEHRIDMKFTTFSSKMEYVFYFEAKRLKENDRALTKRYIETGIDSFVFSKYPNGLLVGYLMGGSIHVTIAGLNLLLEDSGRYLEILQKCPCKHHDQYYESQHSNIGVLKHLFFDFTI